MSYLLSDLKNNNAIWKLFLSVLKHTLEKPKWKVHFNLDHQQDVIWSKKNQIKIKKKTQCAEEKN